MLKSFLKIPGYCRHFDGDQKPKNGCFEKSSFN